MNDSQPQPQTQPQPIDVQTPIFIYPKRIGQIIGLLICIALLSAFIAAMVYQKLPPVAGYPLAGLLLLFTLSFMLQLLPGSRYLLLDDESFTYRVMFRAQTHAWAELESIGVMQLKDSRLVVWCFVPDVPVTRTMKLIHAMSGFHGALTECFSQSKGMTPDKLALMMETLRRQHAGEPGPASAHEILVISPHALQDE